jgi:hypothetical protein
MVVEGLKRDSAPQTGHLAMTRSREDLRFFGWRTLGSRKTHKLVAALAT